MTKRIKFVVVMCSLVVGMFAGHDRVLAQSTWTGSGTRTWTDADSDDFSPPYNNGDTATFSTNGAGTVTIDGGGVTPAAVIVTNTTTAYTFTGGSIGGTGSLTKMGSGTLTLTNANSFSGGVFINGGILNLPSGATAANLGDSGNEVTFTGTSSLTFGSGTTLSQVFVINTNVTGTLQVGNANVTINNSLAGSGNLTAINGGTSGGTFSFTSTNNTFSGNIKIYSSSAGSYFAAVSMNSLADSPGSRITLGNNHSTVGFSYGAGAVVPLVLSNRQIEFYANSEFASSFNNNATNVNCTVTVNTDLLVSRNSAITFTLGGSNSGNNTFAGAITNRTGYTTSLTKAGTGNWILTGTNNYTGTNTISGGTLSISKMADYGQASPIGNGTAGTGIALIGGALVYTGTGDNTDRLIQVSGGSGTLLNNGAGALNFTAAGNFNVPGSTTTARTLSLGGTNGGTISGTIQNNTGTAPALSLAKIGIGTWILVGTSTYSGSTDVNAGSLTLQSGATTITQTLGALRNQGAEGLLISSKSGAGDITTTFSSYSRAAGASGNIVSTGGINGTDNSVNITGAAGFINNGLFFGGSEFAARNASNGFVRALAYGSDPSAAAVNTITGTNHVKLTGSPASQNTTALLSLNLQGDDVNWMNNDSQYLTSPGILKSGGGSSTISGGFVRAGTTPSELVVRTDSATDTLTISSVITTGTSGTHANSVLTKSGAGTLVLSGVNTFQGQTHVNAGTLSIGANVHLGVENIGGTLNLKGGTLRATGTFGLFNGTAGTNNRAVTLLDQSTIEVTGANTLTIAGVITNFAGAFAPGFTKTGSGTLVLRGNNTYTGPTIINEGTLGLVMSSNTTSRTFNGLALDGGALELMFTVAPSATVPALNVIDLTFSGTPTIRLSATPGLFTSGVTYPLLTVTGTVPGTTPNLELNGVSGSLEWVGNTLALLPPAAGTVILIR